MKYGHEDKKTGISLNRDVYAEHFADHGDIKTNYMVQLYGDIIAEREDPKQLAEYLMKVNKRLCIIADFLKKIGSSRTKQSENKDIQ